MAKEKRTPVVWFNGKFVEEKEAKIDVLSHGLHHGSGVFEGIRFYETEKGTSIFRLDKHVERLFQGAKALGLKIPYSEEEFMEACKEIVRVNKLKKGYLRPIVFYGKDTLQVPPKNCPTECVIATLNWGKYVEAKSPKIKISSFIRIDPKSLFTELKICGNYVNSILAVQEAMKEGFDEALLLDNEGNVAECSAENIQ